MSKKSRQQKILQKAIDDKIQSLEVMPEKTKLYLIGLGLSLFALIVYILTLYPTVGGGDSGELTTGAYTWGILHPPGYPLYTMIGHMFTWLPWGSVAWRVNLFSAICDAGAVFFIFMALSNWLRNIWLAAFSALLFAFSPLIWQYAVQAEVFAGNNLIISILFFLAVLYDEQRSLKIYLLTGMMFGIGMTHHHTSMFVSVPMLFWMTWQEVITKRKPLHLLYSIGCFFLALTPYVYLAIASPRIPLQSWGGDLSSFSKLLGHFLRSDYGTFQLAQGTVTAQTTQFFIAMEYYFKTEFFETLGIGFALFLFGFWKLFKSFRGLAWSLLASYFLYLVVFHILSNLRLDEPLYLGVQERFWQQLHMMLLMGAAWGFYEALVWAINKWPEMDLKYIKQGVPAFVIVIVLFQLVFNYKSMDQSKNYTFKKFGEAVLSYLPKDTLLFSLGDIYYNSMRYLQECENMRKDVKILERAILTRPWGKPLYATNFPDVVFPSEYYTMRPRTVLPQGHYTLPQIWEANRSKFPIAVLNPGRDEDLSWENQYSTYPYGYVSIVVPKGTPYDLKNYLTQSHAIAESIHSFVKEVKSYPRKSWELHVHDLFWGEEIHRSLAIYVHLSQFGLPLELKSMLVQELQAILDRHPNPPPMLKQNLEALKNQQ